MWNAASGTSAVPTRYRSSSVGHVELRRVGGQEARAVHGLLAHQHGRHDRGEPLRDQDVERVTDQRELQQHDVAEQVDEA